MVGCKLYERGRGRIRLWSRIKVLFSQKQALLRGLNKYSPGNWLEKAMNNSGFEGRGSSSILIVLLPSYSCHANHSQPRGAASMDGTRMMNAPP